MTTRTWKCMCGNFVGQVEGDPALAVWCHCGQCRQQTGAAMQLGVWPTVTVLKGGGEDGALLKYKSSPTVSRNSCSTCGSFCYKNLPDGTHAVPLGALSPSGVKPSCHIFVADKGDQDVMFPELPQHDAFP